MTRPTREQVDESLRMTDHIEGAYADTPTEQEILLDSLCRDQVILAREVRALREELDVQCKWRDGYLAKAKELEAENARLKSDLIELNKVNARILRERQQALNVKTTEGLSASEWMLRTGVAEATIARVEELPATWRAKGFMNLVDKMATSECADELEAALRGPT